MHAHSHFLQPIQDVLEYIVVFLYQHVIENYGIVIILLTIIVRLVLTPLTISQTRSMADTRLVADSLLNLIKSGASFESLAKSNSDDQGSAQIGGDLGWFTEALSPN